MYCVCDKTCTSKTRPRVANGLWKMVRCNLKCVFFTMESIGENSDSRREVKLGIYSLSGVGCQNMGPHVYIVFCLARQWWSGWACRFFGPILIARTSQAQGCPCKRERHRSKVNSSWRFRVKMRSCESRQNFPFLVLSFVSVPLGMACQTRPDAFCC